jgi:hypothetical protein
MPNVKRKQQKTNVNVGTYYLMMTASVESCCIVLYSELYTKKLRRLNEMIFKNRIKKSKIFDRDQSAAFVFPAWGIFMRLK